jgi:hypothetical protein
MVVYLTGLAVGENYIGVPLTVVGTLTASRMDLASQALTLDPGADSSYSGLTATTLRCGAVTLGSASGTARTGRLTIGGTGSVASIARAGSTTGNVLTLSDGATLIASGTLTGTGINLTSGAGAVVVGGTMTGWGQAGETMSGSLVHYWPAAAGTNLSAEVTESSPSRAQRNLRHGRMGALVWLA